MGVFMDICNGATAKPLNTGANEQCFEGVLKRIFVAKKTFSFASETAIRTKANWIAAIKNKDIVPLYEAYEVASANVEAKKFESGNFTYETEKAIKKTTFESFLGYCSHKALRSYAKSDYTRVFEHTDSGVIIGVINADGTIKGQELSDLHVDMRTVQTNAKVPFTKVTLTYKDYEDLEDNAFGFKPTFDVEADLQGIFDVHFTQISATDSEIKFTASAGCAGGGSLLTDLTATEIEVKDGAGAVQAVSFVVADAQGVYTITGTGFASGTGTGFASGYTVNTVGVVTHPTMLLESGEPLKIVI